MTGFPGACRRQQAREQPQAHLSRRPLRRLLRVLHPVSPCSGLPGESCADGRNNVQSLFGGKDGPTDVQTRNILDAIPPKEAAAPLFQMPGDRRYEETGPESAGSERTLSAPSPPFFVSLFP